jgi:chitinase
VNTLQAATLAAGTVTNGAYTLTATVPANNTATSYKIFEGTSTTPITSGTLVSGKTAAQTVSYNVTGKAPGTYVYKVTVSDGVSSLTSPQITVTVPSSTDGAWAAGVAYKVGDIVTYNGIRYKCIQAHTSLVGWEPPNVPALWQKL